MCASLYSYCLLCFIVFSSSPLQSLISFVRGYSPITTNHIMCPFFVAAMSQRRQVWIGRYVVSFVMCSCFLSMHCFCDCFTNTKHFRHLFLSSVSWTLNEVDRWGFTIIHSLAWPASELGWVKCEGSGGLFVCLYHFVYPALLLSFVCCNSALLLQG